MTLKFYSFIWFYKSRSSNPRQKFYFHPLIILFMNAFHNLNTNNVC